LEAKEEEIFKMVPNQKAKQTKSERLKIKNGG
jgi:hypothetical protein